MLTPEMISGIALTGAIFLALLSTAILLIINRHHKYKRIEREITNTPRHVQQDAKIPYKGEFADKTDRLEFVERIDVETEGPPELIGGENILLLSAKSKKSASITAKHAEGETKNHGKGKN